MHISHEYISKLANIDDTVQYIYIYFPTFRKARITNNFGINNNNNKFIITNN